jgi:predicted nucleotidyltransferase
VSKLLKTFRNEVSAILKGKFVALYVFGSLAMDDFGEHQSDIDFMVLISKPLSDAEGKRLQVLHEKLRAFRFGDKLEGEYVEISALHAEGVKGTVARCEGGILKLNVQSEISAENILDLRQNAYAVCGPNPKSVIPAVPRETVNRVMQDYLKELNEELKHIKSKSLNWLSSIVLDICRTLYTLKTGRITSKSAGARWALRVLSPE